MPLKIIRANHIEIMGDGYVLLSGSLAGQSPTDVGIGPILEETALVSRSYAVVCKQNKTDLGPDRVQEARTELRNSIESFIADNGIRMILDVAQGENSTVIINAIPGETASPPTLDLIRDRLSRSFKVELEAKRADDWGAAIMNYARKDAKGDFAVEAVELGFSLEDLAEKDKVVNSLAEVVALANRMFGFTEAPIQQKSEH